MPQCRLNSRRRKKARRLRNALQGACIDIEDQAPPVSNDALESTTTTITPQVTSAPKEDTAKPGESATTTESKPPIPVRRRKPCKHRRLPDRNYYHRAEALDYRYLAFQRRTRQLVDEKIADGHNQMARWRLSADTVHWKFQNSLENQATIVRRESRVITEKVEDMGNKLEGMEKKLIDLEKNVTKVVGRFERLEERLEERLKGYDREVYGI
ncbi:hypothetical protein BKA56DRAFT_675383 [Ilyonectria sp. MPI-CAGE-AT-0026]|nr:hypothetical protein BKA56DRAFT_675383 [Ilyonectria sp. MPI-CAGE-AT-0026]